MAFALSKQNQTSFLESMQKYNVHKTTPEIMWNWQGWGVRHVWVRGIVAAHLVELQNG